MFSMGLVGEANGWCASDPAGRAKLWDKHNIRQVAFWTTVIGEDNQLLYYVLEWKDLAERERAWASFQGDPEWHKEIGRAHV